MQTGPLVSVITNFFNTERFLREAIEGVLAQTYTNWELLLIDDGSVDGSTAIALDYSARDPVRIRYLEHEGHRNLGTATSRNLGIAHARGEFIAPLDSDDVWFPRKLEEQVAILQNHAEAAMVFGNRLYWNSWKEDSECADSVSELGCEANTIIHPPGLMIKTFVTGKTATPCPSDMMIRRNAMERIGGFEEEFREMHQNMYEDQAFLVKILLNEAVIASTACWNKYRLHPDSTVSVVRRSGKQQIGWLFYLNWLEKYLMQKEMVGSEIWQTLQSRLWPSRHPILYNLIRLLKQVVRAVVPAPARSWLRRQFPYMR